jgi:signal transduction histidine kinase
MGQEGMPAEPSLGALQRALEASEARFRNIIEKNADGVLVVGRSGVIRFVNPAAESLLGRPADQLLGQMFGVPVTPGETTEIDILRGGRPGCVAEMRLVEIDWEGEVAYLASLRDVTERKQAADAARFLAEAGTVLAGSLDTPRTLASLARVVVSHLADWCLIDMAEPDQSVHRAAVAHRDPAQEVRARGLLGRFTADGRATSGLPQVLRGGQAEVYPQVHEGLIRTLTPDPEGEEVLRGLGCGSAMLVPLHAHGRTLGAITFLRATAGRPYGPADLALAEDLARRAALALDNARLYDESQEGVRRRDEFLAMLAHELRNPLAPILSAAQIMCMRQPDDPALRRSCDVIERQCKHMARLLDDLLDISRVTRGKIELRPEAVELAPVVEQAVETSRPLVKARRHQLSTALPPEPVRLRADPTRLCQVVANLLINAAKYTPPGGRIWLTAGREGEQAVVRVRDTGDGIAPDMLSRIFEPFTQAGRTLDRSEGGLGIGLTLARRLVQLHGGSITALSEGPGRGSEFVVRLPLVPPPPGTPPAR